MTVINVNKHELDFHNVGIIMGIKIKSTDEILNPEPDKNESWDWMSWDEFMKLENKFYPFEFLFAKGLDKFEKFKAIIEKT